MAAAFPPATLSNAPLNPQQGIEKSFRKARDSTAERGISSNSAPCKLLIYKNPRPSDYKL